MPSADLLHTIALSLAKGATPRLVRRMAECAMSREEFFALTTPELVRRLGINERYVPRSEARHNAMWRAREELKFVENGGIKVYGLGDEGYPVRLNECPDAPLALYVLGEAGLDVERIMSVVGTRRATVVGLGFVDRMLRGLTEAGVTPSVVSGLAYGIDTSAHEGALRYGLPTVAVVAHGLDTIYPPANRNLARDIISKGGALVTEYPSATKPFRPRFLERNRIVAGLSDLTLVVESEVKGGAMSTARLAFDYNRVVGAVPGRWNDDMSAGCHKLINSNKAQLIASAADVADAMDWHSVKTGEVTDISTDGNLFAPVEPEKAVVYDYIKSAGAPVSLTDLQQLMGLGTGPMLSLLGDMELDGIVIKLPGNKFTLVM